MNISLISSIKKGLKETLPGRAFQYKMAPSDRAIREQAIKVEEIKKSAVLMPLFYKNNKLHVLLTQRANYNGPHGGQISFPGGKFEAAKDYNLYDTAIRETKEEISLESNAFEILGGLTSLTIPVSKISVQPYLAFCTDISKAKADGYELTGLYQIPISHLMNPENTKQRNHNGLTYPYYDFEGKVIWGATAMMLSELLEIISRSEQI